MKKNAFFRLMGECELGIGIRKRGEEFFESMFSDTVSQGVNFLRMDNLKIEHRFFDQAFFNFSAK